MSGILPESELLAKMNDCKLVSWLISVGMLPDRPTPRSWLRGRRLVSCKCAVWRVEGGVQLAKG